MGQPSCIGGLAVQFVAPLPQFTATLGQQTPLQVQVNVCSSNAPFTDGLVGVTTSENTTSSLTHQGNGLWVGLWTPVAANSSEELTAFAASTSISTPLAGSGEVGGVVQLPPPPVTLNQSAITFSVVAAGPSASQTLTIANNDSQPHAVTARASGGAWLSLASAGGTIQPQSTLAVPVNVDPGSLGAGSYSGTVAVTSDAQSQPVGVALVSVIVSPPAAPIQLTASAYTLAYQFATSAAGEDQQVTLTNSNGSAVSVSVQSSATWLGATPSTFRIAANSAQIITVSAVRGTLGAGAYSGSVSIQPSGGQPLQIAASLTVNPAVNLTVSSTSLVATLAAGGAAQTQMVSLQNPGATPAPFFVTALLHSAPWLSVSPALGTVPASVTTSSGAVPGSVSLGITMDPGTLAPGSYDETLTVASPAGNPIQIQVNLTVVDLTASPAALTVSLAPGGAPLTQTVTLQNPGSSAAPFVVTVPASAPWLSVSPASGTVPAGAATALSIVINPGALTAGSYTPSLAITNSAGGSISIAVNLTVVAAPVNLTVSPASVTASATSGGSPVTQMVTLQNPGSAPVSYVATVPASAPWLSVSPATGSVPASVKTAVGTAALQVTINPASLGAGSYSATILIAAASGSPLQVAVTLNVTAAQPKACTPSSVVVSVQSPARGAVLQVGSPVTLKAQVVDNCGNPPTSGVVSANFSLGDHLVNLVSVGGGNFQGTWTPATAGGGVITFLAIEVQAVGTAIVAVGGAASISVTVTSGTSSPVATAIANAASFSPSGMVAQGSLATIFGSNLADCTQQAALPLPTQLCGTQVLLGGTPLPILYASASQINVQVPYEVAPNATFQLILQRDSTLSTPLSVVVAAATPGIFVVVGATGAVAGTASPLHPGNVVVVYCTGLGAVTPPVADGVPAQGVSSTVNPVTMTIGGLNTTVLFAGLTPGFPGLYQVNALVPAGVAAGDQVPLAITAAGLTSNSVPISVRTP